MSQSKAPLVTDLTALIRGASEKPAPVVIGDKPEVVEQSKPVKNKQATKPKAKKEQGRAPAKETFPWTDANPKIVKFVQVRAPEPLHLKLAWIKANSIGVPSVHELIIETLEAMADERIARILKGDRGG